VLMFFMKCRLFCMQALSLENLKTHHWSIFGSSAVTGGNLLRGIDWLLDDISCRIFTAD